MNIFSITLHLHGSNVMTNVLIYMSPRAHPTLIALVFCEYRVVLYDFFKFHLFICVLG